MATAVPINVDLAILMIYSPLVLSSARCHVHAAAFPPRASSRRLRQHHSGRPSLGPVTCQYSTNCAETLYRRYQLSWPGFSSIKTYSCDRHCLQFATYWSYSGSMMSFAASVGVRL